MWNLDFTHIVSKVASVFECRKSCDCEEAFDSESDMSFDVFFAWTLSEEMAGFVSRTMLGRIAGREAAKSGRRKRCKSANAGGDELFSPRSKVAVVLQSEVGMARMGWARDGVRETFAPHFSVSDDPEENLDDDVSSKLAGHGSNRIATWSCNRSCCQCLVEDVFFVARQGEATGDAQMVSQHHEGVACTPSSKSTSSLGEASVDTDGDDAEKTISGIGI